MTYYRTILILTGAALLILGVMTGCKKQPQNKEQASDYSVQKTDNIEQKPNDNSPPPAVNPPAVPDKRSEEAVSVPALPKLTLNEIVRSSNTWDTAYTKWYGKESPDFTVVDLNGQSHTLSKYKGKNVLLVFWATWCGPCLAEIPHLIELRKEIGEDKLVILGISFVDQRNSVEAINKLVKANPVINYPIAPTNLMTMPKPYLLINVLPTSFFIDPQGKIKLAAEGLVPLPQIKAIIEAEK
jgi:thiol-disulfide isomerase/thioredoxin